MLRTIDVTVVPCDDHGRPMRNLEIGRTFMRVDGVEVDAEKVLFTNEETQLFFRDFLRKLRAE